MRSEDYWKYVRFYFHLHAIIIKQFENDLTEGEQNKTYVNIHDNLSVGKQIEP